MVMYVSVGANRVPILLVEDDLLPDGEAGNFNSFPKPTVCVSKDLTGAQLALTVLHELIHCIADTHGVNLKERQVLALEQGLGALIHNNPHWTRWFLENLHADDPGGQSLHAPGPPELPEAQEAPGTAGA